MEGLQKALQARNKAKDKLQILTHCNTGSLATAEYGTALGVIRATAEADKLKHAYCTETRPYNQGQSWSEDKCQSNIPSHNFAHSNVAHSVTLLLATSLCFSLLLMYGTQYDHQQHTVGDQLDFDPQSSSTPAFCQ